MNAVAYLRVSGINQVEGDGFDRQILACDKFAAQQDLTIVQVFREEGVSGGKELDNRPALQDLLVYLDGSDAKTILIEKLDRLARDLMVQETIIADLQKSGYTLISVMEPDLCSDDPSRKLMRQIFGGIAEYERAMIVLKLRGARQRMKVKTGRCEGRKPFGEDPKLLAEAPILAEIRAQRAAGLRPRDIAAALNIDAVPTRSGVPWRGSVVAKILRRNPGKAGSTHFAPPSCAIARTSATLQRSLLLVKPVLQ